MTTTVEPTSIAARPRARRRSRGRRWLVAALLLVIGAGSVWLVWFSSVLASQRVLVLGVQGARADAVLARADLPLGVPLARIDTASAERAVADVPWVADVEVRRGWPNEVVVAVTPRTPAAVLATRGASPRTAVDAQGMSFESAGPLPRSLPRVDAEGAALAESMAVLSTLPPDLAARVVTVRATTRDDVTLTLRSGDLVRWGSRDQAEFKAEVLRALMKRKALVYDVSAPELPTTFRPRS